MTTGERIKQRRKELGLSAEYLAKKLKVSAATVYRYENGGIEKLPVDILEPLSQALDTTPAYLMGWEVTSKPTEVPPGLCLFLRPAKCRWWAASPADNLSLRRKTLRTIWTYLLATTSISRCFAKVTAWSMLE